MKFSAKIFKLGINPVVDPPANVLSAIFEQAGKDKGPIPVCGLINGAEFIQALIKYKGAWRLYVNGAMLKASGLAVGEPAKIEIEFDPRPRETPVPPPFAKALKNDKTANTEFDKLTAGRRKEILRYLGSLKTEESLERNIERVFRHLRGQPAETSHALRQKRKAAK